MFLLKAFFHIYLFIFIIFFIFCVLLLELQKIASGFFLYEAERKAKNSGNTTNSDEEK